MESDSGLSRTYVELSEVQYEPSRGDALLPAMWSSARGRRSHGDERRRRQPSLRLATREPGGAARASFGWSVAESPPKPRLLGWLRICLSRALPPRPNPPSP